MRLDDSYKPRGVNKPRWNLNWRGAVRPIDRPPSLSLFFFFCLAVVTESLIVSRREHRAPSDACQTHVINHQRAWHAKTGETADVGLLVVEPRACRLIVPFDETFYNTMHACKVRTRASSLHCHWRNAGRFENFEWTVNFRESLSHIATHVDLSVQQLRW